MSTKELSSENMERSATKLLGSCDACRGRKVRCLKKNDNDPTCISCDARGHTCHFSRARVRRARGQSSDVAHTPPRAPDAVTPASEHPPTPRNTRGGASRVGASTSQNLHGSAAEASFTYPQSLLPSENNQNHIAVPNGLGPTPLEPEGPGDGVVVMQDNYAFPISSSCLAFFSETKVLALSRRLGHTRVRELVNDVEAAIQSVLRRPLRSIPQLEDFDEEIRCLSLSEEMKSKLVESYFEHVHPVYPFLDAHSFRAKAQSAQLSELLSLDRSWCALYHAVLSLGSLYHDCGGYTAFSGTSWAIFRICLSLFSRLVFSRGTLTTVQAMTAMALFSQTFTSLPIENILIGEASRMSTSLNLHKMRGDGEKEKLIQRTFWIIYCLDNDTGFNSGRSTTIPGYDITCPIPETPISPVQDFDWLRCWATYSKLLAQVYENLFSGKARSKSRQDLQKELDQAVEDLETWKFMIPDFLAPWISIRPHRFANAAGTLLALRIHFLYHNLRFALLRTQIVLSVNNGEKYASSRVSLAASARAVIDATQFIPLEPFTSPWMLYHMPQSALFVLFDFVVEYPVHEETKNNLAYMQLVVSYFMRVAIATKERLYDSVSTEFWQIATSFVEDVRNGAIIPQPNVNVTMQDSVLNDHTALPPDDRDITNSGLWDDFFNNTVPHLPLGGAFNMGDMDVLFPDCGNPLPPNMGRAFSDSNLQSDIIWQQ